MRRSDIIRTSSLIMLLAITLLGVTRSLLHDTEEYYWFFDATLRYNEVACAHGGTNPFKVWNRESQTEIFKPLPRKEADGRFCDSIIVDGYNHNYVHAYPPWHTTFFWWAAWLPKAVFQWGMFLLNVVVYLLLPVLILWKVPFKHSTGRIVALLFCWSFCTESWGWALRSANYGGGVIPLSFALMIYALKQRKDWLAGVAWAVMMIKPQIGVLLFWPLLFQKRYLAIGVAVALCLFGALWPAYVYRCSPLELILEIPKIGEPYISANGPINQLLISVVGDKFLQMRMFVGFVVCGAWSYVVRRSESWLVRCIPVLMVFPVWTYGMVYDKVLWLFFFATVVIALQPLFHVAHRGLLKKLEMLLGCAVLCVACSAFQMFWEVFSSDLHIFDPNGIGWIYRAVEAGSILTILMMAVTVPHRDIRLGHEVEK